MQSSDYFTCKTNSLPALLLFVELAPPVDGVVVYFRLAHVDLVSVLHVELLLVESLLAEGLSSVDEMLLSKDCRPHGVLVLEVLLVAYLRQQFLLGAIQLVLFFLLICSLKVALRLRQARIVLHFEAWQNVLARSPGLGLGLHLELVKLRQRLF